jgi:hypothetical protein
MEGRVKAELEKLDDVLRPASAAGILRWAGAAQPTTQFVSTKTCRIYWSFSDSRGPLERTTCNLFVFRVYKSAVSGAHKRNCRTRSASFFD